MGETVTEMAKIPKDVEGTWTSLAARRVAFQTATQTILDGVAGETFDEVRDFEFSFDGKRTAYVAKRGEENLVVVDGAVVAAHELVGFNSLTFSPSGRRVAYTMRKDKKYFVVVDGVEYGPLEDTQPGEGFASSPLSFAGAEEKLMYAGKRNGRFALEIEGERAEREYELVRDPIASRDAKNVVYRALADDAWLVVWNGRELGPYEKAQEVAMSDDGEHVVFAAADASGAFVVADGTQHGKFRRSGFAAISARGEAWICDVEDDARQRYIVRNGELGPAFGGVWRGPISADGKHFAYFATRDDETYFVVHDGREIAKTYANIVHGSLALSPDGQRVAYLVDKPETFVVVGEQEGPRVDGVYDDIVFSADGAKVVYMAQRGDAMVLIEQRTSSS